MATTSTEILHDFFPLIREYKDGRVERLTGNIFVPASVDHETGVQSKYIDIAPDINLSARLYLPKNAVPEEKIPLLVYFHGGGFVIESAFSPLYHKHINLLVAEANVFVVSMDYRLAPEHPLPTAYEDSWLALKWVESYIAKENNCDEWIKDYADMDRIFLGGDSLGANIAHYLAMRISQEKLEGIKLRGIFLNSLFFWGKDAIVKKTEHLVFSKIYLDKLWIYACPSTSGSEYPLINPATDANLSSITCDKVLVYVVEKDVFRERGWHYKEALIKSGWKGEVEVVDVEGEDHYISVFFPESENGKAMLQNVASFLNHSVSS